MKFMDVDSGLELQRLDRCVFCEGGHFAYRLTWISQW
jgi:hypothetical protein